MIFPKVFSWCAVCTMTWPLFAVLPATVLGASRVSSPSKHAYNFEIEIFVLIVTDKANQSTKTNKQEKSDFLSMDMLIVYLFFLKKTVCRWTVCAGVELHLSKVNGYHEEQTKRKSAIWGSRLEGGRDKPITHSLPTVTWVHRDWDTELKVLRKWKEDQSTLTTTSEHIDEWAHVTVPSGFSSKRTPLLGVIFHKRATNHTALLSWSTDQKCLLLTRSPCNFERRQ